MGVWDMTVKRTRLCYWIAGLAKPGVQSSNTIRVRFTVISHTPMHSHFYHTHIMYKRNWDGSCLVNLIYFVLHFSNSQFGECQKFLVSQPGAAALWRHTVWMCIVMSHNAWMGYEYSLPNLNHPRAIHKHNPHPLEKKNGAWVINTMISRLV